MIEEIKDFYFQNRFFHNLHILETFDSSVVIDDLKIFLNEIGIETKANPYFFEKNYDLLSAEQAREICDLQILSSPEEIKKIFLLSVSSISEEAQNILLKTLEEPTERTSFFLLVPTIGIILPTILSRSILHQNSSIEKFDSQLAEVFLKSSPTKKMEIVDEMIEKHKKGKFSRQEMRFFLISLEKKINEDSLNGGFEMKKNILDSLKWLNQSGASVKYILENLAVQLG